MEMEILDDGIWNSRNDWGFNTSLLDTLHHPSVLSRSLGYRYCYGSTCLNKGCVEIERWEAALALED